MNYRRLRWKSSFILAVCGVGIAAIVLEAGAHLWLTRLAPARHLQLYGTVEQNKQRALREARAGASNAPPKDSLEAGGALLRDALESTFMYEPHRYIGYVPSRNLRRGLDYHSRWGYRGEDFPFEKPEGEFRIACLGGSTTYTIGVTDPAESYPAQLERLLHKQGMTHARVINAGVPGWTTYESLINYELRLVEMKPDLLVVYHGINDLKARMVMPFDSYRADNSGMLRPASEKSCPPWYLRSDFLRTLLVSTGAVQSPMALNQVYGIPAPSYLFWQFYSQQRDGTYPSGPFVSHPLPEIFQRNPPIHFERNLRHLIALAKHQNAEVLLLTFKVSEQTHADIDQPAIYDAIRDQNVRLRAIGRGTSTPVFDFASEFPDDPQYYVDDIHVNADGGLLMAELIAQYVSDAGLILRRSDSARPSQ